MTWNFYKIVMVNLEMNPYICTPLDKTQRAFFEARKNPNYAHGLNFKRRAIAAAE